jgi:hypothetical protein
VGVTRVEQDWVGQRSRMTSGRRRTRRGSHCAEVRIVLWRRGVRSGCELDGSEVGGGSWAEKVGEEGAKKKAERAIEKTERRRTQEGRKEATTHGTLYAVRGVVRSAVISKKQSRTVSDA